MENYAGKAPLNCDVLPSPAVQMWADVRFGSFATFARNWHVRFAPKSDRKADLSKSDAKPTPRTSSPGPGLDGRHGTGSDVHQAPPDPVRGEAAGASRHVRATGQADCERLSDLPEQHPLCRRQLAAVVTARKQVAVGVGRHLDGGMSEPRLHHLERQLEPAVDAAVDAPGRIEVAQAVEAGILGAAIAVDHTQPRPGPDGSRV